MIGLILYGALSALSQPASPSPYDRAVQARRAGQAELALELLRRLVTTEPENADAWVQYGFVLRDAGKAEEAKKAFYRALELAPEYADARKGLTSLEPAMSVRGPRAMVDAAHTAVKNAQDWNEIRAAVVWPVDLMTKAIASVEKSDRFGLSDVYGEARVDKKVSRDASVYGFAGGTIQADFRPDWNLGAGGSGRVTGDRSPLLFTLDVAGAHYREGEVWTAAPGFQQYALEGRFWVTGKWINVFSQGHREGGALARADFEVTPSFRVYGGAARAPDLTEGQVIQTTSLFAGAVKTVSKSLELRISVANDVPSSGLRRRTLSAGLGFPLR